ncbi:MAG: hypothetical protein KME27_15735 [Lyngbya sp. HA4199-MV5]|jgi:hypothetical protein|nr:hypothetical protein [Lyngbya sp. HA4199-MV5]
MPTDTGQIDPNEQNEASNQELIISIQASERLILTQTLEILTPLLSPARSPLHGWLKGDRC